MDYLDKADPIVLAVIAGIVGGMTRALFSGTENLELPQYLKVDGKHQISLGFLKYCWVGVVAAVATWSLATATNDNAGVLGIAIISGFTSVYFFEKLKEREKAIEERDRLADTLSDEIDALLAVRLGKTLREEVATGEQSHER